MEIGLSLSERIKDTVVDTLAPMPTPKLARSYNIQVSFMMSSRRAISALFNDENLRGEALENYIVLRMLVGDAVAVRTLRLLHKGLEVVYDAEKLLERLPADVYKDFWLRKYYALLGVLINSKSEILKFIEEKEGVNSFIEFYYNVLVRHIVDTVDSIRQYKARKNLRAVDDTGLKDLVITFNMSLFFLVQPLLTYLEGRYVNYELVTMLLVGLAKKSTIPSPIPIEE